MRFLKVLIAIVAVLAAVYGVLTVLNEPRVQHAYYARFAGQGVVLAHGGGQGLAPDNAMVAFEIANALGADVLELDVQRDSDGAFRVIHDATVDRTTSGVGAVADLSSADFAELDAGYFWTPTGPDATSPGGDYHYRGTGATVPTLTEVLRGFPDAAVNVEIKEDDASAGAALCNLIRSLNAGQRMLVASFNAVPMQAFRKACPEVATSATRAEVTLFFVLSTLRLSAAYTPPFDALQVPVRQGNINVVTPQFVAAAHSRGVAVEVWTINDAVEMTSLLAMGVDGLITDRPDRALAVLGRKYDASLVPTFVAP